MLSTIPSSTVLDSLTVLKQSASKAEAAQWYAENGIPVFPCGTDKRPRIKGGFHAATVDVKCVKAWWRKWPDASIGCPTGEGLGAFVLDVDQPDGPGTLAELESRYGQLPVTLEQRTGGGGRQLFFRMPAEGDVRNSAGKLGEGLDIRGNGGYVILPPSSHPSGGVYQWLEGQRPVEQAPEWLLNLLDPNRNGGKSVFLPQPLSLGGVSAYGNRALTDECAKVAATPEGSRNDMLNQSAYALGQLVGGGEVDRQKAADALLEAARQAGLPHDEALRTLQSGLAAGERSPRQAPQSHRAEELVKAPALAAAPSSLEKEGSFIATLDLSRFEAGSLLATTPAPLKWALNQSLLSGTVGFVCGAPGVGKSTFLLQLAASVATGHPFFGDNLLPGGKGKVLALFAEEDERILVRRVKSLSCAALEEHSWDRMPESAKEDLERNLILVPAAGEDLRFVDATGGCPRAAKTYGDLLAKLKMIPDLSLIVLDPLSRFFGGNENDNTLATAFCQLLEKLAKETGAAVVCCHHVAKGVGQTPRGFNLETALSQEAMRGASGLTGAARWQFNVVAMPAKVAKEEIDDPDAKSGAYLAAQVSKKNYGPPESKFFLRRGVGGVLLPVKNRRKQDLDLERVLKEKAYALVKSREEEGEKPLTLKGIGDVEPARWKREGLKGATKENVRQAIAVAIRPCRHSFQPDRDRCHVQK